MNESSRTTKPGPKPGFLREGWRELLCRWERGKLRKQAQESDEERNSALVRLGENAWTANVDPSAFPELRDQLDRLEARVGQLAATAKKLSVLPLACSLCIRECLSEHQSAYQAEPGSQGM